MDMEQIPEGARDMFVARYPFLLEDAWKLTVAKQYLALKEGAVEDEATARDVNHISMTFRQDPALREVRTHS